MRISRKATQKSRDELEKELIQAEIENNRQEVALQLIAQVQLLVDTLETKESKAAFITRFMEDTQDEYTVKKLRSYKKAPVSITEFVEGTYYLNMPRVMYPKVLDALEELNSGAYVEGVLTGAIGTGKTTIALITTAYQLYLLSLIIDPHELFGIAPTDEILFVFQSISASLAKSVDYMRFRAMVERCDYFQQEFPFRKDIASELLFPNRIIVRPISGDSSAAIGQNVFGGIIDEINYMAVTDKSKRHIDGGTYNQAIELYNSIARRRKSRFMKQGKLPGVFCLVSSKRYPGQFTDQKENESKKEIEVHGKTSIFVYDKRTWDIKPESDFCGKWFMVFIGDDTRRPRIMTDNESVHPDDRELVLKVPIEYEYEFGTDIINALREIGGISTLARFPFMMNREAITGCFDDKHIPLLSLDRCDFLNTYPDIVRASCKEPWHPRWIHGDLSITGDSTGLVMGHVPYFRVIKRSEHESEILPVIRADFILEVVPPKGGEISYSAIRDLIYRIREAGVNLKWATFDSFQSQDMLHILRTKGFITGLQSMDKEPTAYNFLKGALYDGRIEAPNNVKIRKEILGLEKDPATGKIDHPPMGSKDLSDALAGVTHGLTMRREIWALHNVNSVTLPSSIRDALPPKPIKDGMKGDGMPEGM